VFKIRTTIVHIFFWMFICTIVVIVGSSPQSAGAFVFSDGTTATCYTRDGQPVREIFVPGLAGPFLGGYTGVTNVLPDGSATISWDPVKLERLPPAVHDFIYFHECAHAHVPTSDELQANCVGLRDMTAAGRASPPEQASIGEFHAQLGYMGPKYGDGATYWRQTVRCAAGVDFGARSPASSRCQFSMGPRAGQIVDYAPMAPLPIGSSCQDGWGSFGRVVP
jgi:hypothetical protein